MSVPQRRILIVDDDHDFAISTSRVLKLEGIDCLIASDGVTAISVLEHQDVRVVLMDIRLEREDGTELAARLRRRHPDLIMVIMTAYASVDSAVAALKVGAYDYLRKPFFIEELMRALERCYELLNLRQAKAKAERELTLIRQLEATAQLAAGLSHDFKNMLAVIQANLAVLNEKLGPGDALKPYASDAHEVVVSATGVLSRLMGFILDKQGQIAPIDLRDPIRAAIMMLSRTLCSDMQIRTELPEWPLIAVVDPYLVETAVVNLLLNSRDATAGQGQIDLSLREVWHGAPYAQLILRDNGPGLTADVEACVLEPFFTTKTEGTGLGLPLVQQLALRAGGTFRIGNSLQGGAEVVLELPCRAVHDGGTNM